MTRHVHFIGIGGTGLSAIARVLLERGETVSGSDRAESPQGRALAQAGARVYVGHRAEQVRGADLVVRSSAVPDDNVEVQAARAAGIPVLKRVDFLGTLLQGYRCLAVAGTHGKTTTTAMLAWTLTRLGADPSFIVGSEVLNLGVNAHAGRGPWFVIEADEYDFAFLGLTPDVAVVTYVEHEHPDCFPTPVDYARAFRAFVERIPTGGALVACVDDPGAACLLTARDDVTPLAYGLAEQARYRATDLRPQPGAGYAFRAWKDGRSLAEVSLQVPGRHNVLNALAALAVVEHLGWSPTEAAQALAAFRGTGRRFEVRGEFGGVLIVDDYGHHPTEIRATLAAARARYPGRPLWAVWQPHTYSRTRMLLQAFARAFGDADHVLVTEVYAAREPAAADFSAQQVVRAMHHPDAHFVPTLVEATAFLLERLRPGDVLLVLSAGDATRISRQVAQALEGEAV